MLESLREANPWRRLSKTAPYVLDEDAAVVARLNSRLSGTPKEIRLEPMPEPFMGTPQAPIWLLNLNPGFDDADLLHDDAVRDAQRKSIELSASGLWPLEEDYSATPAFHWWNRRLGELIKDFGANKIAKSVFCLELFPYHPQKFYSPAKVPSQSFTHETVRAGCEMGKLFVFIRGKRQWLENVPELSRASTVQVNTPRCAYISKGNIREHQKIWDSISSHRL